jgi:hypothetical protein
MREMHPGAFVFKVVIMDCLPQRQDSIHQRQLEAQQDLSRLPSLR